MSIKGRLRALEERLKKRLDTGMSFEAWCEREGLPADHEGARVWFERFKPPAPGAPWPRSPLTRRARIQAFALFLTAPSGGSSVTTEGA